MLTENDDRHHDPGQHPRARYQDRVDAPASEREDQETRDERSQARQKPRWHRSLEAVHTAAIAPAAAVAAAAVANAIAVEGGVTIAGNDGWGNARGRRTSGRALK